MIFLYLVGLLFSPLSPVPHLVEHRMPTLLCCSDLLENEEHDLIVNALWGGMFVFVKLCLLIKHQ